MNQNPQDPLSEGEGAVPATTASGRRVNDTVDDISSSFRDFVNKVPETINKAVERALNVRDSTVLLRLSEPVSESVDTLVTAGVFKNRAEARLSGKRESRHNRPFSIESRQTRRDSTTADELRHSLRQTKVRAGWRC